MRWSVRMLTTIAREIRARRGQEGALELEGVEVQIQMDKKDKTIEDLMPKQVEKRLTFNEANLRNNLM